jgi:prepilin-type N-terminal cleavage/methylation domain-containing protein
MFKQNKKTFLKNKLARGFTLVELLVTLTIFSIMTGIVLANQSNFNNTIFLSNLAHDVALTLRQAQTYGINVKESSLNVFSSYGVSFSITSNKNFILFADSSPLGSYDGGFDSCPSSAPECVDRYSIKRGNYIKSICAGPSESECDSNNAATLNILFQRPDSDAHIRSSKYSTSDQSFAKIVVASENGNTKSIIVRNTGQIYVE